MYNAKPQTTNKTQLIRETCIVLVVMWIAFAINTVLFGKLNTWLMVRPRSLEGVVGIALHPFAHSGLSHLLANSLPFVVLSLLLGLSSNLSTLRTVWVVGALGSGIGIWLFSGANVVGASGMVFALNGFLLARCYFRPSVKAIAVALLTLFFYSGMLFSLLNFTVAHISWIGHLSGFISGVLLAFFREKRQL